MPLIILVVVVEWACWFQFLRRAAAVAAVALVALYIPLIRSGEIALSWAGVLSGLGRACFLVLGILYVNVLVITSQMALSRLLEALWPSAEGKRLPERTGASFRLWDRDIDG